MNVGNLHSWGGYPSFPQKFTSCHWPSELPDILAGINAERSTTLPFGMGRSYGDSCLAASDHVVCLRPMNRFISADWKSGVLRAEAGITLEEILRAVIPRGWFLSVTPGTKYATLGGAIANDVHGKNHHRRGTFGVHVRCLGLVRSDLGRMTCSPQERSDLYAATIGGLGLTGVIEWAEIQLVPIKASILVTSTQRFDGIDEFFALSSELDDTHEYCVSWIDCMASGKNTGRGVYSAANFAEEGPLDPGDKRTLTFPVTPPISLVNRMSLPILNQWYWHRAPVKRKQESVGYDRFFYPLDALLEWNRMYGPRGFQQYQALIPERDAKEGIRALLTTVSRSGAGSFLAVLKRCGSMLSPGLLSFPRPGTTLAIDFPQSVRLDTELFPKLDAIVREAGGCLYPAKDAHMDGEDFRRSYPLWSRIEAMRDPLLMSRFWSRVTR